MTSTETGGLVVRGCCHVYYALDIGFSVDLKRCTGLIQEAHEQCGFRHHTRTPAYLNLRPAPVHISQAMEPIRGPSFLTENSVTITIYDFGAVSVEYRVPFEGTLDQIAVLSSELYDKTLFAADARSRAESLLAAIGPAVRRAKVREETEDYLVFAIPSLGEDGRDLEEFLRRQPARPGPGAQQQHHGAFPPATAGRVVPAHCLLRRRPDDHHLERGAGLRHEHGGRPDGARTGQRPVARTALPRRPARRQPAGVATTSASRPRA